MNIPTQKIPCRVSKVNCPLLSFHSISTPSLPFICSTFYNIWLQFLIIHMHKYISDSHFPYSECIDCRKRSAHVCIKCQYCYSCHPKIEQLEKKKKYAQVSYRMPKQLFTKYNKNRQAR